MKTEPFKMQNVNSKQWIKIQTILFSNGEQWMTSGTRILNHVKEPFAYFHMKFTNNLCLRCGGNQASFNECETPELTYSQFIERYDK
jgi:hypothetical protein